MMMSFFMGLIWHLGNGSERRLRRSGFCCCSSCQWRKLRNFNGALRSGFKSQTSKSNTVGIGSGLGCQPQRVSESKGQPSVVIGLPRLETNYRAQGFLCSVRESVCVYMYVWMCTCLCFCLICPISACSLHNRLIRCISSGLSMLIHTLTYVWIHIVARTHVWTVLLSNPDLTWILKALNQPAQKLAQLGFILKERH